MDFEHEANQRAALILAKIKQQGQRPALIPLTDYADEATFNFLLPGSGWTFDDWHAVNEVVARRLRAEGFNVQLVRVTLPEYFDFLTRYRLTNTPAHRAQFAAWLLAPEPKPTPQPG